MARSFRQCLHLRRRGLRYASTESGLAITDIVQIYRAKVARGELDGDENQLRAV